MRRSRLTSKLNAIVTMIVMTSAFVSTGCQIDVGGQTLPSPYYVTDDVQYFPAGPEFQLSNEARAMELFEEESQSNGRSDF